ncbi:MAG: hypothetical protein JO227_06395 [Acetobacteraceae bacterium]|nr:hypothetical protein [Acetobacteraceae bacterium]
MGELIVGEVGVVLSSVAARLEVAMPAIRTILNPNPHLAFMTRTLPAFNVVRDPLILNLTELGFMPEPRGKPPSSGSLC